MRKSAAALLTAAMLAGTGVSPARADILIGLATAVTGPQASFGQQSRNGADAAIAAINSKGGVAGEKLKLVVADDGCDAKQGVTAANQLVNQKVQFVVGHLCTGPSVPASEVYSEEGVLMVSSTATGPVLTERGLTNVFRVTGRDDQQGVVAAQYILKTYPNAKVAIAHDKQAYGKGLADTVQATLAKAGAKPVLTESINPGESDFSALITKLKQVDADVIYYGGYHAEAGQIVRQARQAGYNKLKLVAGDGLSNPDFWNITGDSGAGTLFTLAADPSKDPKAKAVVDELKAKGIEPASFTLYTYAAVQVIAQGIEKAGKADPKAVIDALRKGQFDTVIGPLSFDKKGDLTAPNFVINEWKNGSFQEVAANQ
ncbi:MAG TPA: branched-chain amino acid ABC transporter substrate-binding protein [Azospirillaceae bacterium]|nr:branched-chain amino acid ABC transporter substrate-binding protein [Azospirillaceae bacterium]